MGHSRGSVSIGFNGTILTIKFFNENWINFREPKNRKKNCDHTRDCKKIYFLGFDVRLSKDYGTHLGIMDEEYKKIGVNFSSDDKEILNSNVIVQLGLLSDDKSSLLKEDQTLIGVLNPYDNKEKLGILKNKKIKLFHWNYYLE